VELAIDEDSDTAVIRFTGVPGILEIQRIMMDAIELVVRTKINKVLIDTSELEVMFTLSLYWYRKEWYPLANRSGLKYIAVVLPGDFAHRQYLEKLNEKESETGSIQFQFYTDKTEALNWIRTA
jgi:hypothetical protein